MDIKLLEKIFQIPSQSKKEKHLADFIKSQLDIYEIKYYEDKLGNIFNLDKKGVPLLSAHMDTVQDEKDSILSKYIRVRENILSGYGVIGGDDKCGVFMVLEFACMKLCNFIFSVQEENGGGGIRFLMSYADLHHIPYGIVLDRRGYQDIVCTKNNYGTQEFENIIYEIGKLWGYAPAQGLWSDANLISEQISCANLSVGYFNPHSKQEFVNLINLKNAMEFTNGIIKNVKDYFAPLKRTPESNVVITRQTEGIYNIKYCDYCNNYNRKTIFVKTIGDYICTDCLKELKKEIEMNENILEDKESVIDINVEEVKNKELDNILNEFGLGKDEWNEFKKETGIKEEEDLRIKQEEPLTEYSIEDLEEC
jgi:hypothetical protein